MRLNKLGSTFTTCLTILNKQAQREDKFLGLDELLKNLEDEEARMRQDPTVTANVPKGKVKGRKNSSGARSEESKKKKEEEEKEACKRCGENHPGKCKYSNSPCTDAGRKVT